MKTQNVFHNWMMSVIGAVKLKESFFIVQFAPSSFVRYDILSGWLTLKGKNATSKLLFEFGYHE